MGTIYFDDKDIKESKIALANQKITPLQSTFLMQYITNLETQLQQEKNIIEETKLLTDKIEKMRKEGCSYEQYKQYWERFLETLNTNKGE